ncbi:hypothetical protein SAMN02745134_01202 [Clostridium acidisoli DSM 12555]|uniref:Membrane protein CcdC involved in cytochrome C biogenesis n=1 Tax=Clostridium acidisoli DSM 12555 TaxID=1121291 RepID=A0A1W1XC93_9CLOT|nr:hypothetical protein [Clostridium acidisoli]SMC21141.1 hypothetical protein SAMN02745134_01202 [Clostridium acidisoli DSM 12555]
MWEILIILLIMFKGLKSKEVGIKTFIALPIIMLYEFYDNFKVGTIQATEISELIVLAVIAVIAGIILGNMKLIEVDKGKYYIRHTYKYIVSWIVIILIRILVSKFVFKSSIENFNWISWAYFLVYYTTRSITMVLRYPEVLSNLIINRENIK